MKYDILVNKDNILDKDFVPDNLVPYLEMNNNKDYKKSKVDPNYQTFVEKNTIFAFFKMQSDAYRLFGYKIIIDSAYRSYEYQEKVYEKEVKEKGRFVANTYVAMPGSSEHQTGFAIDVAIIRNNKYIDSFDDSFDEIKWLHDNAYKYGFILRYPKDKTDITGYSYECWHIRYVGLEIAEFMHNEGIDTLEEYHERIKCKKL